MKKVGWDVKMGNSVIGTVEFKTNVEQKGLSSSLSNSFHNLKVDRFFQIKIITVWIWNYRISVFKKKKKFHQCFRKVSGTPL